MWYICEQVQIASNLICLHVDAPMAIMATIVHSKKCYVPITIGIIILRDAAIMLCVPRIR